MGKHPEAGKTKTAKEVNNTKRQPFRASSMEGFFIIGVITAMNRRIFGNEDLWVMSYGLWVMSYG